MCHGHGTRTTLIAPPPDNDYPRLLLRRRRRCRFPRGRVRVCIINAMRTFGFFFLLFFFSARLCTHTHTHRDTLTHVAIITQHYCDMGMCVDGHCETFLFVSFFPRFHSTRVSRKNDKIKWTHLPLTVPPLQTCMLLFSRASCPKFRLHNV